VVSRRVQQGTYGQFFFFFFFFRIIAKTAGLI
jgi:hypothetical protein